MAPERGSDGRSQPGGGGATSGLPPAFLRSLRTLFDILDDRRRGYVPLREIESRWLRQGSGEARELPRGVLEGLRRAAPASGYLTFERFVLGLRSSLLGPDEGGACSPGPAAPARKSEGEAERGSAGGGASRSLEQIAGAPAECKRAVAGTFIRSSSSLVKFPPTPPSWSGEWGKGDKKGTSPGWLESDHFPIHTSLPSTATKGGSGGTRKLAGQARHESTSKVAAEVRRQPRGCGEHRRHTITNGVDYGMLKHMKELEKEKDVLLQGLELAERVRNWCHQRIQALQERQKRLGSGRVHSDSFAEGALSHHLLPKLQALNQCLGELLCLSAKPPNPGFAMGHAPPSAPTASPPLVGSQQAFNMLKEQNRLLTMEVTDKSERITQLEREKSTLIKQLFEARAHSQEESNQLDSTFI
ncbi:suppressor APC domain-containing protein 2 [Zootoca vivipara]|uniref:suppressor APC domain-containing protein 2 n=1 Tax=Zootoca vivipara TaxID=8524 RepID=UPI00293BF27B|nr:suppressor APC domain-containing protein 2 [Zootoca vivipara]